MPAIGIRNGNRFNKLLGPLITAHGIPQRVMMTRRRSRTTAMAALAASAAVASASTCAATAAVLPTPTPGAGDAHWHQPRLVYRLGTALYVPLTSRCNSMTLPQTRGESFLLPDPVVDALCAVRDMEASGTARHSDGSKNADESADARANRCQQTQTQTQTRKRGSPSSGLKRRLPPPPFDPVPELPGATPAQQQQQQREPTVDRLLTELERELLRGNGSLPESIVVSGEGEPMLRLDDTMELVRRIRSDLLAETPGSLALPSIRLTTNGLVPTGGCVGGPSVPQKLWDCGVSHISVGLMTWNARQYNELMRPVLPFGEGDGNGNGDGEVAFDRICDFVREAVRVGKHSESSGKGLVIETTAVDRPDVDRDRTEAFARALGVTTPVRWRPFFP